MKPIRGHVDGFEGRFIFGWAICDGDDTACLVKIVTPDGREIARGRASHPREDLHLVGNGRKNIAFRISVKLPQDATALLVMVEEMPLAGSPITIGKGVYDGNFIVRSGMIEGVVTERAVDVPPPRVHFEDQYGRVVARGMATYLTTCNPNRPTTARIKLPLSITCFGFDELELCGYANDVVFARSICEARLAGYLDKLSTEQCRGWLLSPDAPYCQFDIEVFCSGEKIGGGRCELPREDLQDIYPLAWRTGFDLRLKSPKRSNDEPTKISIRLAGTDTDLFGGPFLLGERAAFVAVARRASALIRTDERFALEDRESIQQAIAELIAKRRNGSDPIHESVSPTRDMARFMSHDRIAMRSRRFNIVIPVYRDVDITQACIESVFATRDPDLDSVILVNDCSPEPTMDVMLASFTGAPNVYLLNNTTNRGFVGSINRALRFCRTGHIVMLNSDTRVFPGAWHEMDRLLALWPDIGTITALSNNATIFSYPHRKLTGIAHLEDASWQDLAALALVANAGQVVDVPTGHGFCMLIRREVLDRVGYLDTRFGRGYGEENDFCQRVADFGWRNVAACGVFVQHHESVSFADEKFILHDANVNELTALYPDYMPAVAEYERTDGLRVARWPLDQLRLQQACSTGTRYALVVQNWLGGGTKTAIRELEAAYGYDGRERMTLTCRADGMIELEVRTPVVLAIFAPSEGAALFTTLEKAGVDFLLVHQLLGYSADFIEQLGDWGRSREMKIWLHDFYTLCPRVTMLNAVMRFCKAADAGICARCVQMGGIHEASRLNRLSPVEHRALFAHFLKQCTEVIAPSTDTVLWAGRIFSDISVTARPHPHAPSIPELTRDGDPNQIVLIGAIGPHKGSRKLLELAQEAHLTHPDLRFRILGYTDIDQDLRSVGNVTITGPYEPAELPALVSRTRARVALFLNQWPETFSYTLSEVWEFGLWPVVPDLGAPAERVRRCGVGTIMPNGISLLEICALLSNLRKKQNLVRRRTVKRS